MPCDLIKAKVRKIVCGVIQAVDKPNFQVTSLTRFDEDLGVDPEHRTFYYNDIKDQVGAAGCKLYVTQLQFADDDIEMVQDLIDLIWDDIRSDDGLSELTAFVAGRSRRMALPPRKESADKSGHPENLAHSDLAAYLRGYGDATNQLIRTLLDFQESQSSAAVD